jgi:hypothetical protein
LGSMPCPYPTRRKTGLVPTTYLNRSKTGFKYDGCANSHPHARVVLSGTDDFEGLTAGFPSKNVSGMTVPRCRLSHLRQKKHVTPAPCNRSRDRPDENPRRKTASTSEDIEAVTSESYPATLLFATSPYKPIHQGMAFFHKQPGGRSGLFVVSNRRIRPFFL